LSSLWLTPQVSAGASGIVFGILGAAVVTGVRHRARLGPRIRHHFGLWVLPFLLITLGITLGNPAVDHGSHLGGLVAGLLYAPWMRLQLPYPIERNSPANVVALTLSAMALVVAPAIARGGPPVRVAMDQGWSADIPGAWALRTGLLGEHEWTTAGGFVVLAADQIAPSQGDLPAWYLETRLRPLQASRHVLDPALLPQDHPWTLPEGVSHARFEFRREQTPMVRDVYFLPGAPGSAKMGVASLEVPRAWVEPYGETRRALVESLRNRRGNAPERPRISIAALE